MFIIDILIPMILVNLFFSTLKTLLVILVELTCSKTVIIKCTSSVPLVSELLLFKSKIAIFAAKSWREEVIFTV